MHRRNYDVLILGGSNAGLSAAEPTHAAGLSAAVVEERDLVDRVLIQVREQPRQCSQNDDLGARARMNMAELERNSAPPTNTASRGSLRSLKTHPM
jgi:thioredoxin reductase